MKLVFAYGSNLNPLQMVRRCPATEFFSTAELPGFRLVFAGSSPRWGGAVATLERAPRSEARAHGVLYHVTTRDLEALDRCEGHPAIYRRTLCAARNENGIIFIASTYVLVRGAEDASPPSNEYFGTIRRGYDAWRLPIQALFAAERRSRVALTPLRHV